MKTIYKYPLKLDNEQAILMPENALIISAGLDSEQKLCIWAAVNTTKQLEPRFILIYATDQEIIEEDEDYDLIHINSVVSRNCVWHVFQKIHKDRLNNLRDNG